MTNFTERMREYDERSGKEPMCWWMFNEGREALAQAKAMVEGT